jgi:hypothetical protein
MRRALACCLVPLLVAPAIAAACGGASSDPSRPPGGSAPGDQDAGADVSLASDADASSLIDVPPQDAISPDAVSVIIDPPNPTITVQTGKPVPTIAFTAKANGAAVPASWLVDRGEIGAIGKASGVFTPGGTIGGIAKVTATVGSAKASTQVTVKIETVQNGAVAGDGGTGTGGWGGVGGEGPGGPIDSGLMAVLLANPTADPSLRWLYPYDGTVWPTGVLAPLLQWTAGSAPADSVHIRLTSANYDYKGFFGRPPALSAGAPFVHHPIPQEVWKAATLSSAGGKLAVSIVIGSGGKAFGPIAAAWTIANGPLKGTVYYQSYGTKLAKNYEGGIGGDGKFGGATLAIKGGSTDPILVAGGTGGHDKCRVCHSVSADGSRMIVQHGDDYASSSSYALGAAYAQTPYAAGDKGKFGWVGLSPDGAFGLGNAAPLHAGELATSQLYDMKTGAPVPAPGLAAFATRAGFPAFSPDGKHVAFNFFEGPGDAVTGPGDGNALVAMGFDPATHAFSKPKLLHKPPAGSSPGWPSFLPSNDAVVFSVQSRVNQGNEFMMTRYGGRGQLWWADLATGTAHALDRANGKLGGVAYLPQGPNAHDDDTTLQYEPTVNPVVSGGYAWVVFTSRRMYGNVATIDPWWSDPRDHDLTVAATTKKLWVAAIELGAKPGTDPSHPAFYLPAQELMAGNTRGFWVVDPCKPDGKPCESGDECCGGYCQQDADAGGLVCSNHTDQCSNEYEKCTTHADCCDFLLGVQCINGRCARTGGPR